MKTIVLTLGLLASTARAGSYVCTSWEFSRNFQDALHLVVNESHRTLQIHYAYREPETFLLKKILDHDYRVTDGLNILGKIFLGTKLPDGTRRAQLYLQGVPSELSCR